jgi:subtilisin family serine protease
VERKQIHRILFSLISLILFLAPASPAQIIQREPARPLEEPRIADHLRTGLREDPERNFKVWVFFTDKGTDRKEQLDLMVKEALNQLPSRSLSRREKATGEKYFSGLFDLPVSADYVRKVRAAGARERAVSRWLNAVSVRATASEIREIAKLPFVHSIRPVAGFMRTVPPPWMERHSQPQNPVRSMFQHDYGNSLPQVIQIMVPALHDMGYTGSGVLVGVLDAGFRKDHAALSGLDIVAEHDFVFDDDDTQYDPGNPEDYSDFHGTGVLSIMAGNAEGDLVGPAFGASFLLGKTEDTRSETPVEEDFWVEGIEWMESQGVDIVSSSLGYTTFDDETGYEWSDLDGNTAVTTVAADFAASLGVLVVNAGGNERQGEWGHIITPADGDSVCAVGAVDALGTIASFSSPGPSYDGRTKPEVSAMGVGNYFALNVDTVSFSNGSGTSFATPLVAGASALLAEVHPEWTAMDLLERLKSSASRSGTPDNDYGWGIINALRAADLDVPYVLLLGWTVDDDSTGESLGNGNGFPEAGETIELPLLVTNSGDTSATGLSAVLRTEDAFVTLMDSTETFPDLMPDDTTYCEDDFLFALSDSIPAPHTIFFTVLVTDSDAREWEYSFGIDTGELFRLTGEIRGPDMSPLPGAMAIVLGPIDSLGKFESALLVPANEDGQFETFLDPGFYAAQALQPGYLMNDAFLVGLPPDTSLLIQLTSPLFSLDTDSVVFHLGLEQSGSDTIRVTNAGSGSLTFSIQEANGQPLPGAALSGTLLSGEKTRAGGRREKLSANLRGRPMPEAVSRILKGIGRDTGRRAAGTLLSKGDLSEQRLPLMNAIQPADSLWNPIYGDTDQKTDMDIETFSAQFDPGENMLYLRLSGWRPWREVPGTWYGAFLIDADTNPFTGDPTFGNEYLLLRDPFQGSYIVEWSEASQDYEFLDYLSYTAIEDSLFELGVSLDMVELTGEDLELMHVSAGFLWPVGMDTLALNDALPDDGGSLFATVSIHDDDWLGVEPRWVTLSPGASAEIVVRVDVASEPPGTLRSSLLFVSNEPLSEPFGLPVIVNPPTGVEGGGSGVQLPRVYSMSQNYPNPFNPLTSIRYDVPSTNGGKAKVLLRVYDVRGRFLRTLVDAVKEPGSYSVVWDGRDERGETVSSGIYFYRMISGDFTSSRKMILIK